MARANARKTHDGHHGAGRLVAGMLGLSLLAGCGAAPPDQTYSVPLTGSDRPLARPVIDGTLMIDTFRTDAVLVGRRIAWRDSPEALAINTYANHLWNAQPPRLLQSHLHHCLGAAGVAEAVVMPTDRAEIDLILGGEIRTFEQHKTGADSARVAVTVDFRLSSRRTRDLVWQETLEVAAPAASAAPDRVAPAMVAALDQLCAALIDRLPRQAGGET